MEPARAPRDGVRLVGLVHERDGPADLLDQSRAARQRRPAARPDVGAALLGLVTVSDADDTTSSGDYGWTDLTYLLHRHHVSWRYYLTQGTEPDCADGAMTCAPVSQNVETPEIWNPLPDFVDVHQDRQLGNIVPDTQFFRDAYRGRLPAVSWVIPSGDDSDHQGVRVRTEIVRGPAVDTVLLQDPAGNLVELFQPRAGYHER